VAGVEGALVTARALRSPAPFEAVRAVMAGYARAAAPRRRP
jgi:TetR/AcrR family transcriptional repressor of lmrAB and yxaGH operons